MGRVGGLHKLGEMYFFRFFLGVCVGLRFLCGWENLGGRFMLLNIKIQQALERRTRKERI